MAVFSGRGRVKMAASCSFNSLDNLYQQRYPTGSWGKKYLSVPQ
ncbi:MAG: hypothetical protein ACXVBI_16020 [Flavisolibacter sp.]